MAHSPLPDQGLGLEEGQALTPNEINLALWRAQEMLVEMLNIVDGERRERQRQADLVKVMEGRLQQQSEQLQRYKAAQDTQHHGGAEASMHPIPPPTEMQNPFSSAPAPSSPAAVPIYEGASSGQPQVQQVSQQLHLALVKLDLPKVYGNKKDQEVGDWIFQMTMFFTASGFPEQQWGLRAALNLDGKVLIWFCASGYNPRVLFWADFTSGLLNAYRSPDFEVRARDQLDRCKQTGGVAGYVAAFRQTLVRCSNIIQEEALHRFVRGLKQDFPAYVCLQGPYNLSQAYQIAGRWALSQKDPDQPNRQDKNGGREKVGSTSTRGTQGGNQGANPKKKGFQGSKKEETGKKKFQANCFVCRKPGHHTQDCY